MANSKVAVIGLWHLGSVYAACLAELGHEVIAIDSSEERIKKFKLGQAPLYEPGLDDLIKKGLKDGNLSFATNLEIIADRDFVFVAFDTPVDEKDQSDLTEIEATVKKIAEIKKTPVTIVVSSQVPVGTCDEYKKIVKKINPTLKFDIVYLPENLRLGDALNIFLKADRFVVGTDDTSSYEKMAGLLSGTHAPFINISLKSAEMAKHSLNSFLATCVSFTNELADFCDLVGADITEVATALKSDVRIGQKAYLNAGLGFAGGTLARDLVTLTGIGEKSGLRLPVIEGTLATNAARADRAISRILDVVGPIDATTTVGVLGLTYKPGTSTLRRSISLDIIKRMTKLGIKVKAYDPKANMDELKEHKDFTVVGSQVELAKDACAILIITGWPEFKDINYQALVDVMRKPVIIDLINFASPESQEEALKLGFNYYGTGRKKTV